VRKAALQTLRTLTRPLVTTPSKSNGNTNGDESKLNGDKDDELYLMWTPELLQEAMRYVYQRVLFEHVHEIQEIALQVWFFCSVSSSTTYYCINYCGTAVFVKDRQKGQACLSKMVLVKKA
jgi:hypothetical protein